MSELLILREIHDALGEKNRVNLKELHEVLENPVLTPYLGDFESFKAMINRLELEGVLKLEKSGDVIYIIGHDDGSKYRDRIAKLEEIFSKAKDEDDFKDKVYTCELNQHFLDSEEVKIVFYYLTDKPPETPVKSSPEAPEIKKQERAPAPTEAENANDDIEQLKNVQEMKIKKLEQITKDYVEELLKDENEIEITTLSYLLDELLPLKEMREDEKTLIAAAIEEKSLPWVLEDGVYKRTGEKIKKTIGKNQYEENMLLRNFTNFLISSIGTELSIDYDDFKAKLVQTDLFKEISEKKEGITMESLLEEVIEHGMFKGYVDAVERKVFRPKTAEEKYQESFKRELDNLSEEIKTDEKKIAELKETEEHIPKDLESLLTFPDKPRDFFHALDSLEHESNQIQEFILRNTPVGKKVSIIELNEKIQQYMQQKDMELPFSINNESVENILEGMVKNRKLMGYFEDDTHFKREAS